MHVKPCAACQTLLRYYLNKHCAQRLTSKALTHCSGSGQSALSSEHCSSTCSHSCRMCASCCCKKTRITITGYAAGAKHDQQHNRQRSQAWMATRTRERQPDVAQQIRAPAASGSLSVHLPHTAVEPLGTPHIRFCRDVPQAVSGLCCCLHFVYLIACIRSYTGC